MINLATIYILEDIDKEEVELTWRGTEYRYANIKVEFLVEYSELDLDYTPRSISVEDVKLSNTTRTNIINGMIYIVHENEIADSAFFNDFAKPLYDFTNVPIYEDKFIMDIREDVKFIIGFSEQSKNAISDTTESDMQNNLENYNKEEQLKLLEQRKISNFLENLIEDTNILVKIAEEIDKSDELYLDVYDTNGLLTVLTNDSNFEFYFDIGDVGNNFNPLSKNPFGVSISHFHKDHYNILKAHSINADNYILPYRSAINYNGKIYRSGNEIQMISSNLAKTTVVLLGIDTPSRKHNIFSKIISSRFIKLYLPKYTNVKNRNLESIGIEFMNLENTVYLPGDTMNYMYKPYMKSFDYLISSHHGGYIGKPDFNKHMPGNIIVNTYHKNYGTPDYTSNINYYRANSHNLIIQNKNDGLSKTRIKLK